MKKQKSTKKVIIITGTPCTGKTKLARKLSLLLKFKYIDVNKLIQAKKLYSGYDRVRDTKIIPIPLLIRELTNLIRKSETSLVIDSHLSHFLPSNLVDLCFVCKCPLKELEKRLKKRHYHKKKIRENLDSEIFDVCFSEAQEKNHNILIINTSKMNLSRIVIKIKKKLFL